MKQFQDVGLVGCGYFHINASGEILSAPRIIMRIILKKFITLILRFIERYTDPYSRQIFVNLVFKTIYNKDIGCPWSVHYTSHVNHGSNIKIGKGVEESFMVSGGCYIQGTNGIEIGDGTIFAPGVKIISANHDLYNYSSWIPDNPIRIGKNCWIGANAVILPGVELGDHVIVGAGAIVTKNFPDNVVIAGNPAHVIRFL